MLDRFLSVVDNRRAVAAFAKIAAHDVSGLALAGGIALEIHWLRLGRAPRLRTLNDIDFITSSFDRVPGTFGRDFLLRHVHPFDPQGKTLMQMVYAEHALRIDIFRANPGTLARTVETDLPPVGRIRVISVEDVAARTARLVLDLAAGTPTPAKHAHDFSRVMELVEDPARVEEAWRDHRKQGHPESFAEAASLLARLIPISGRLLVTPEYSKDPAAVCERCFSTEAFRLADPQAVLSLLGYC